MRKVAFRFATISVFLLLFFLLTSVVWAEATPSGALVIVGGGNTPEAVVKRVIALAGGENAPIVILAHVREKPDEAGKDSAMMFQEWGAKNVIAAGTLDPAELKRILATARGVWIPGGDQNRFAERFPESSGVPEAIRGVFQRGGVVGGTSAGASLMGELMPTGAETKVEGIQSGGCPVREGLNLLPQTIVDQHFLKRNRLNRLLTALLEHPNFRAFGIEEGSWGVYHNSQFTVEVGQVVVLQSRSTPRRNGTALGISNVTLRILLPGDKEGEKRRKGEGERQATPRS
jgi:cyanophycinase